MDKDTENKPIRLNKYLAHSGIGDRRKCDELIKQGLVSVNGDLIIEPGVKVLLTDKILFRGEIVNPEKKVYILINKPKDMIFDEKSKLSILDLVKSFPEKLSLGYTPDVFATDELKRNELGLMIITNDQSILKKKTKSVFHIILEDPLEYKDLKKIQKGMSLNNKPFDIEEIEILDEEKMNIGLKTNEHSTKTINDGFSSLGYKIQKLDRTIISGLTKKDLPRGNWRFLKPNEVIKIKHLKY